MLIFIFYSILIAISAFRAIFEGKKMKFKPIKNVTPAQLKFEKGVPVFLRFEKPFALGKEVKNSNKPTPLIAVCTNMETGEIVEIIVPAVLDSIITEEYGLDYVGRMFRVEKTSNPEENGKKYAKFSVIEFEIDAEV